MNLVFRYGQLFWNTACLTVNAGGCDEDDFDDDIVTIDDEDESDTGTTQEQTPEQVTKRKKAVKYGKIAKALCNIQNRNVNVLLPDINKSKLEFYPDLERDGILFGLRAVSGLGDDLIQEIINNRPYSSLKDFINKIHITPLGLIPLIKAGCFDELFQNNDRTHIMKLALKQKFTQILEPKVKLTMQNFPAILKYDLLPEGLAIYGRYFNYRKYIYALPRKEDYIELDEIAQEFFKIHFQANVDHIEVNNITMVVPKSFEDQYQKEIKNLQEWLKSQDTLDKFNQAMVNYEVEQIYEQYCQGSTSYWEMQSLNFYHGEHELEYIDKEKHLITDFAQLPEEPIYELMNNRGREYKKYELSRICGTVIDKNKTRHIVYLLTTNGVVNVKFYGGAFAHYNKQISQPIGDGKKKVLEKSWFKRGTKLMLAGYRRGDYFYPKKYFNSLFQHTVNKIELDDDNNIFIQTERINPYE